MSQNKVVAIVAFIALVLGVYVALVIAPPGFDKTNTAASETSHSTTFLQRYPQPRALSDVSLIDHKQDVFSKQDFKDKWSLLFVGYTYCPDICPTTLAALNNAYPDIISAAGDTDLQVVFLSVDPKRDTPERLSEYMRFFNEAFVGVTGEHSELFPFVRSLGMMYSMTDSTDKPNYLVDHSASIVVINPKAQVIGQFKPQGTPGAIPVSDMDQVIADLPAIIAEG